MGAPWMHGTITEHESEDQWVMLQDQSDKDRIHQNQNQATCDSHPHIHR